MATSITFEQICAMFLASPALARLTAMREPVQQLDCRSLAAVYRRFSCVRFLLLPRSPPVDGCTDIDKRCEQYLVSTTVSKQVIFARKWHPSLQVEGRVLK